MTAKKLKTGRLGPGVQPVDRAATATTVLLTVAALLAFAGNSLLCRLALGVAPDIDPVSFTSVRLASGAALLLVLLALRRERPAGDWLGGLALFAYALPFSLAYVELPAGTGALLLFGSVQLTMLSGGLRLGERPGQRGWLGIGTALTGLVVLTLPGLAAPSPAGAGLMLVAGIAWGIYSLHGRLAGPPLAATAGNFLRGAALAGLSWAAHRLLFEGSALPDVPTPRGLLLALISGAVTSGLGYVLWYAALPRLGAVRAAAAQLGVPLLAALGGIALLDEPVTRRLVAGSCLILGGLALALRGRPLPRRSS